MSKVRVNISIDDEVLDKLDIMARDGGVTRSNMIKQLVNGNFDSVDVDVYRDRILLLKGFVDDLEGNIEAESRYETQQQMKADAFYQLLGCIDVLFRD